MIKEEQDEDGTEKSFDIDNLSRVQPQQGFLVQKYKEPGIKTFF